MLVQLFIFYVSSYISKMKGQKKNWNSRIAVNTFETREDIKTHGLFSDSYHIAKLSPKPSPSWAEYNLNLTTNTSLAMPGALAHCLIKLVEHSW